MPGHSKYDDGCWTLSQREVIRSFLYRPLWRDTARAIGEILGVSTRAVERWRTGATEIRCPNVLQLVKILTSLSLWDDFKAQHPDLHLRCKEYAAV